MGARFEDSSDTLVAILQRRAAADPGRAAFRFLPDRSAEPLAVSYGDLDSRARAVAATLATGFAGARRALLIYPPGLDFLFGLFGCMYAGVTPVPTYPPADRPSSARLDALAADADPDLVLTVSTLADQLGRRLPEPGPPLLVTDRPDLASPAEWHQREVHPGTPALLQYTSGSTRTPRGVLITHENLLANQRAIDRVFRHDPERWVVSWLPVQHDMGLIGGVFHPIFLGAACALIPPLTFLRAPIGWLETISQYRATTSGGPNFGYELCIRRTSERERARLDLSQWTLAFNGSEPVAASTLERFASAFAASGFRREAFLPCYGLAEATLFVSGARRDAQPTVARFSASALTAGAAEPARSGGRVLVGCGRPAADHQVLVTDPDTRQALPAGRVGELWVAGPSIAHGYHGRPSESSERFHARLADGGGPYLRTGDLGFVHDGDLFVTGRRDDLVIVRGRNHYPHDIERTVSEAHAAVRAGCCAAFLVTDGDDVGAGGQLAVVAEIEPDAAGQANEIVHAIRQAVSEEHALLAGAVALAVPGAVPKTSSGKVQRAATRTALATGGITLVNGSLHPSAGTRQPARWEGAGTGAKEADPATLAWLAGKVERLLRSGSPALEPAAPLTRYGLDSLLAAELQADVEAATGVRLPLTRLLGGASLADLARMVEGGRAVGVELERTPTAAATDAAAVDRATASGRLLSHGQEALWFMHQLAPDSAINNLAFAARVLQPVDVTALQTALADLVDRHPALRTTYRLAGHRLVHQVHDALPPTVEVVDASTWDDQQLDERLRGHARGRFHLEAGPLLRALVLRRGSGADLLALATHHIACDFASLVVFLDELGRCYDARRDGGPATLPPLPMTHADHVRRERALLAGVEGERLSAFWEEELRGAPTTLELPTDRPRPPRQDFDAGVRTLTVPARLADRVNGLARENHTTPYVVLLAAFASVLSELAGQEEVLVASPVSGRTRPGTGRVVGSLAHPIVVRVTVRAGDTPADLLARTRRRVVAALDHQELPFPLLVQRLRPARDSSRPPLAQVMFDYLQTADPLAGACAAYFASQPGMHVRAGGLALESLPEQHPNRIDQFDLALVLVRVDGDLSGALHYRKDLFDPTSMAHLHRRLLARLDTPIDQPLSPAPAGQSTERC